MNGVFDEQIARIRSGTHAVVDLDAYASNIGVLQTLVGADVSLMAVVKADAYGHGAFECGRAAVEAGATVLGVARIQEALYLRRAGLNCPIMLIGPPSIGDIRDALQQDITLAVGSWMAVDGVVASATAGLMARVHVKVDTGMNRYGFSPDELCDAVEKLASHPNVEVEGVFTHFSSADELDPVPTDEQIARFWRAVDRLDARGLRPRYVHTSNSAAILTCRTDGTNLVRSGIATYGLAPSDEVGVDDRFQPVMSVHSVVARRGVLRPGEGVSYGRTYVASSDEPVAAVPVGYADGLPRRLRNQGWFVIEGRQAPIRGSVCMDQTVVSVPDTVAEGDRVLVLGAGTSGEMTFDSIAAMIGTVNYEVATRLMARVPRVYVRGGEAVAWELVLSGERGQRS